MASFFDKMVVGINKGVNAVSETSKTFAEKAKLNVKISETEKEMNNLYQCIGSLIYNLYKNDEIEIEKANAMFQEMDNLSAKMQELQEAVRMLDAVKVQGGGMPMQNQAPVQNAAPAETTCSCGHVNVPGAKFCAKCGTSLQ